MIVEEGEILSLLKFKEIQNMSCFCNLFDNSTVWLIIIALILLFFFCGTGDCCGGSYPPGCGYNGCANYNNGGCGCGCNG